MGLGQEFRIGDCVVRPEDGTVCSPSGTSRLGPRPMAVLATLASEPGRVFTRDELMARVWAGLVVSDETLSRCISDLRQALDDDSRAPRYIETLPRRGYRLIEPPLPAAAELELGSSDDPPRAAPVVGDLQPRPRRMRDAGPWLALALVPLLALVTWLAVPRDALTQARTKTALAVLPFVNLSDEPELEYFSDGLAEELLHRLAGVDALAVVARTSSFAFKGTNKDVREIGRALGVDYVLEGSVRRHGDRIRIGAQLVDVVSGYQLFSRVYERPFSDLFAIQEHVALEVGAALEPQLAGLAEGLRGAPQETVPEALEAYLLGKHLQRRHSAADLERSVQEFRRAIELDPAYARAYAGLAETLALRSQYAERPIVEVRDEIDALVEQALALAPQSGGAWHARGLLAFYENRLEDALEAFETAHRLDPNAVGSIGMQAWTLRALGRNREALTHTALALRKDPINVHTINVHATLLAQLGDLESAEPLLRRSLEIDPSYLNAYWGMGYSKWLAGDHADAVRWYRQGIDRGIQQGHAYNELGRVLLELGDFDASREWLEAGLKRTADPVSQLDGLLAWHQYQGDFSGLAETVRTYDRRFPDHVGVPPFRAFAALVNGDPATAIREYESLTGGDSTGLYSHWDMAVGSWHALYLARARQLTGETRAAELTLREAERQLASFEARTGFPGTVAYHRAAIASLRNDPDTALAFLQEAIGAGWRRAAEVRTNPLFAGLRDDARLETVLSQADAGLEAARLVVAAERSAGTMGSDGSALAHPTGR